MEFKEWLDNTPEYFPTSFSDTPPNHNPLIGETPNYTIRNVHQVLKFVQCSAEECQRNELSLSFSETWGLWQILGACCDALQFEDTCRPDGGEPIDEENDKET